MGVIVMATKKSQWVHQMRVRMTTHRNITITTLPMSTLIKLQTEARASDAIVESDSSETHSSVQGVRIK